MLCEGWGIIPPLAFLVFCFVHPAPAFKLVNVLELVLAERNSVACNYLVGLPPPNKASLLVWLERADVVAVLIAFNVRSLLSHNRII